MFLSVISNPIARSRLILDDRLLNKLTLSNSVVRVLDLPGQAINGRCRFAVVL